MKYKLDNVTLLHNFLFECKLPTVIPHIRPAGIITLCSLQMFHKVIRIAGIIRGRALYEEVQ